MSNHLISIREHAGLASAAFPAWELPNRTLRLTGIQATPALSTANGTATTHLRRNVSFVDSIS